MAGDSSLNMHKGRRGVVFFAHGSRDSAWIRPIEAVAEQLQDMQPDALCACAYLELSQPDLVTACQRLVDNGATHIVVLPMFLGAGKHVRVDLPLLIDELCMAHPQVQFEVVTAVGEDVRVTNLLACIAQQYIA